MTESRVGKAVVGTKHDVVGIAGGDTVADSSFLGQTVVHSAGIDTDAYSAASYILGASVDLDRDRGNLDTMVGRTADSDRCVDSKRLVA